MALRIDTDAAKLFQPLPVQDPRQAIAGFRAEIQRQGAIPAQAAPDPLGLPPAPAPARMVPAVEFTRQAATGQPPRPTAAITLPPELRPPEIAGGAPQRLVELLNEARGRAEIAVLAHRADVTRTLAALRAGDVPRAGENGRVAAGQAFPVEPVAQEPVAFAPVRAQAPEPSAARGLLADLAQVDDRIRQLNALPAFAPVSARVPAEAAVPAARRAPLIAQTV
ncbi:MAG: hypothetical protein AAB368_02900 [bacterium]